MSFDPRMTDQLDALSTALDDGADLTAILDVLHDDLRHAEPSFLGLRMTVPHGDSSVVLSTVSVDASYLVRSSLQLPLDLMGITPAGGDVIYFAATPGAFHALAATARQEYDLDGQVVLDGHLTATSQPAVDGVEQLAVINQAVGVLIHHGHTPAEARALITRHAQTTGYTDVEAAHDLINSHTTPVHPGRDELPGH